MAIHTLPDTRPDLDIAADVQHAIDLDREVPGHIHVDVARGEVTLTGRVHRFVQKAEAEQAARGIPGVRGVSNLIEVKDGAEAPDDCC